MTEQDDPHQPGIIGWVREHFAVLVGVLGLFAWFALVWFMFGDVL